MKLLQLLALLGICSLATAGADTFTVINTDDSGSGSLRMAIMDANAHANIDANTPDIIAFSIPGAGVKTIAPATPYPALTDPVVIDGYTQTGTSVNTLTVGDNSVLRIELNGANTSGTAIGLDLAGGKSTVRGLVINRFGASAGSFFGSGGIRLSSDNNVVAGNFFGSDATGTVGLGNVGFGVTVDSGLGNLIGGPAPADRNLFAGIATQLSNSGATGIQIRTTQAGTRIEGNYIGTNAAGDAALGNGRGIDLIGSGTTDVTIGGLTSTPGTGVGNVISGNSSNGGISNDGIYVSTRPGDLTIQGNIIGLDATGTAALPNGVSGINLVSIFSGASTLLIGGTSAGARNVIFNNRITGIVSNADGLVVQGNYIGTDITGTFQPPVSDSFLGGGVGISFGGTATIGGAIAAAGNVISCHGAGMSIFGGSVTVQGNFIGTTTDGITPLGNAADGIRVESDAVVIVGGTASGEGNVIANSFGAGVVVKDTARATIRGNSIYNNGNDPATIGHPGIDLNDDEVTPNDTGDSDSGPNNLQNFPIIASAVVSGGMVEITGSLNSLANTTFNLDFFSNEHISPLGYGEGKTFLGSASVTTNGSGNASLDVTFPIASGAPHVTATATDPNGNTSEFSAALGQLLNISTRLRVLTGDNVLIGGFIVLGPDSKQVIIRGIGPSLGIFVADPLADPTLELHAGDGTLIATNNNWKSDQQTEIEATGLAPTNDLESAIIATLPGNGASYTAILKGNSGTTGVGLVEAYDLDTTTDSKLANISTRGFVDSGDNVLIGGFIAGEGVADVVVRAIGPSLTAFGVADALQNPTLELHDLFGATIAANDDWQDSQEAEILATGLAPSNVLESAIFATLPPGAYTAIVRGSNDTTGVGLVEVYNVN